MPSLQEELHAALRQWRRSTAPQSSLQHLLVYRNIAEADPSLTPDAIDDRILTEAIARIEERAPEQTHVLLGRFRDGKSPLQVAHELAISEPTANRRQRAGIELLTTTVANEEENLRRRRLDEALAIMPVVDDGSFLGDRGQIAELLDKVNDPTGLHFVSIEGMGGVGKTRLAHELIRAAVEQNTFSRFGWVSAYQGPDNPLIRLQYDATPALSGLSLLDQLIAQLLGEQARPVPLTMDAALRVLRDRLRASPHLIVVDNLETVADLDELLPVLQKLADPTRFVLTSRHSLQGMASVYIHPMRELDFTDACRFVRYWAESGHLSDLAQAGDDELAPIYATVGGNPLALRLAVGLFQFQSFSGVLHSLRSAEGQSVGQLYTFIYWRAWESLDDGSKNLLLAMPLAPPAGCDAEYLAEVTDLTPDQLADALATLISRNLIEHRRRQLDESRYAIHSLTRSFLLEQVVRWEQGT